MYEIIEKMFEGENPSSIFEVGVAGGLLMKEKPWVVGGIDINSTDILSAKLNYPQYADNFIQYDARKPNWPIPDNSYDIVFSVGTLCLIEDPMITIKEMLRIAKDKIILAEFHNKIDKKSDLYSFSFGNTGRTGFGYEHRYIRDNIRVFKELGKKAEFIGEVTGKTIIKCKK